VIPSFREIGAPCKEVVVGVLCAEGVGKGDVAGQSCCNLVKFWGGVLNSQCEEKSSFLALNVEWKKCCFAVEKVL
jgi:hypothetical protein